MFDKGLVLGYIAQENEISLSVLGTMWVLIK
jgi:hypothetical protein